MTTEAEKRAREYCVGTVFTDETGNDETLIYNIRFMAFCAGFEAGQQSDRERLKRFLHFRRVITRANGGDGATSHDTIIDEFLKSEEGK